MKFLKERLSYLLTSTRGLVLVAIAMVSLVTAIWGMLSGPLAELGAKDFLVRVLGMKLHPLEREGRIIILYHAIAMAIVAIEVYFITSIVRMREYQKRIINATVTLGYLTSMIFGLLFAYFGHNFIYHGVFLFGLSLMFFAGLLLAWALWPWRKEYRIASREYASTKGGVDLERAAFFTMTVAALGSAVFGAVAGANWGNAFTTFLAEDIVRLPDKTPFQLAVIGHLHIMLTLIAIAITLVVGRWFDFKGLFHKIAMPLMIIGTIIVTLGVWTVVPYEEIAHIIIYVGSVFVMLAALMLVIFGWKKLIREGLEKQGGSGGFWPSLKALLHDPLRFGSLWQMVFMNFTVSGVGIFMAAKLDEIFRRWPLRDERIALTGHWHILAAIIATIILLYYADIAGLKGRVRKWFGWTVIIGSDLAFASATVYSLKRLAVTELFDEAAAGITMLLIEAGLAAVLIVLALLMLWRLFDLFREKGRWREEYIHQELEASPTTLIEEQEVRK